MTLELPMLTRAPLQGGRPHRWAGQEGFCAGDVIGLQLDCAAGKLSCYKNGRLLGVPIGGEGQCEDEKGRLQLPQGLSWAVAMGRTGACVKLMRSPHLLQATAMLRRPPPVHTPNVY